MNKLFEAQIGSHSYNLHTEESDYDKAIFLAPSFEDMYQGNFASKPQKKEGHKDESYYDIRKLSHVIRKLNPHNLPILFSNKVIYNEQESYTKTVVTTALLDEIFSLRHVLTEANLPGLYDNCYSFYHYNMNAFNRNTEKNMKGAIHAYRALDFIIRYHKFDHDAALALYYENNEISRGAIIAMEQGLVKEEDIRYMINHLDKMALDLKEDYYKYDRVNHHDYEKVDNLIKELVYYHSRG